MAAVTHAHKLSGLKQQTLILSQFPRPEVGNQYPRGGNQGGVGPHFLWRLYGAFSSLWGLLAFLGYGHITPVFKMGSFKSLSAPSSTALSFVCFKSPSASALRTLVVVLRAHPDHPDCSPPPRSLSGSKAPSFN